MSKGGKVNWIKKELKIGNELGLHARAAAKLVKLANRFPCEIFIRKGESMANSKSIMGLLTLAAGKGSVINIEARGEEAELALTAIEDLINSKFGEV
ncbi:MAG: HPr family phosphocarrier protein [Deltaproteobacteria bacterium]|nr:HPr family phosphocarrier protein [Deltaproteobacteria bacterium]